MLKKRAYVALGLLAPIAIIAGCSQSDIEKQLQPQQGESEQTEQQEEKTTEDNKEENKKTQEELIKEKIDEQSKTIDALEKEVKYYRTFVKDFTSTFSTEKMNEFIEKEWNYKLMINNINFPKSGLLELSDTSFDLVLTEDKVPYSVIPDEMSIEGRLKGQIQSQITFTSEAEEARPNAKEDVKETNSVITYSFKDVPPNTVINIKITDILKTELGMDTDELQIKIQ